MPSPDSIESRLVARGYELLSEYAGRVGIPNAKLGALMVAWTPEQREALAGVRAKALENGYGDTRPVELEELYAREPNIGSGAEGALEIPGEGLVCPFTATLAYATEALGAGCEFILNAAVTGVRPSGGGHEIDTARGAVRAAHLVNAAGLRSDEVNAMLGHSDFRVTPRRGELIVFDKLARSLVNHVLLPVPTEKTKGVLVSPTVYGNLLLGPTADDVEDKTDRSTTATGLESLMEAGARILPRLEDHEVTATYVGLRAATEHSDYQLTAHAEQRYVCAGGIRSTGITGSLAIAEWVREALADGGLDLVSAPQPADLRMPNIGEFGSRPVPGGGPDRRRPRLRADRLLLRAGDPWGDRRRPEEPDPAGRRGWAAAAHPRPDGPLPGVLLRSGDCGGFGGKGAWRSLMDPWWSAAGPPGSLPRSSCGSSASPR